MAPLSWSNWHAMDDQPAPPILSPDAERISRRKKDHLDIMLADSASGGVGAGWDHVVLPHIAAPEVNLDEVDLRTEFLGRRLQAPLLISGMTGGHPEAGAINATLARAAEHYGIALGVGSQR